jgi:hypothetical protein
MGSEGYRGVITGSIPWLEAAAMTAIIGYMVWTVLSKRGHHQIRPGMLDADGKILRVGARVLCDGMRVVVVCSIDTSEYSDKHSAVEWSYLGAGIMVDMDEVGLIHYTDGSRITQISN